MFPIRQNMNVMLCLYDNILALASMTSLLRYGFGSLAWKDWTPLIGFGMTGWTHSAPRVIWCQFYIHALHSISVSISAHEHKCVFEVNWHWQVPEHCTETHVNSTCPCCICRKDFHTTEACTHRLPCCKRLSAPVPDMHWTWTYEISEQGWTFSQSFCSSLS